MDKKAGEFRGHSKTQTMQTADCRLQTVQTMQTVQTVQPEYFFSTLGSLFSVQQFQNSVQYVLMFVIYPQTAPHKLKHPTVDSIRETCLIGYVWKIPLTAPQ